MKSHIEKLSRSATAAMFAIVAVVLPRIVSGSPPVLHERYEVTASDAAAGDWFGWSVGVSGNTAIVGAVGADLTGQAYLFDVTTGQELRKLSPSDAAEVDLFGASVGISGNKAIVGAVNVFHGSWPSSAYVFDVTTGDELFKFTSSNVEFEDRFGTSVAISGNIAIVGAPSDFVTAVDQGSASLFDVTTGERLFKLTASDSGFGARFGHSVAISGNIAIVSADRAGAAYLFDVTTGQELAKLAPSDSAYLFGYTVGISGNVAIVGSLGPVGEFDVLRPSAYLFDVTTGQELLKLTDVPGAIVAISGNLAVIGGGTTASVYDVTTGEELFQLKPSHDFSLETFGQSVALSGNTAIVGAYRHYQGIDTGSAFVFLIPEPSSFALLALALPLLVFRNSFRKIDRSSRNVKRWVWRISSVAALLFVALSHGARAAFFPPVSYGGVHGPAAIAVGDFNNDAHPDLAVANRGGWPNNFFPSVLLGNGDGTLQTAVFVNTGDAANSVAVGDFNNDGKLDLLSLLDSDAVSVVLGNGDGTFQPAHYSLVGSTPTSASVGDLNGDGKLDLALNSYIAWQSCDPDYGVCEGGVVAQAKALSAAGDGTFDYSFHGTVLLSDGYSTSSSDLADFNGDGKLDFLTVVRQSEAPYTANLILLGNDNGTFQSPSTVGSGYGLSVAAGDLNGDNNQDVVSLNFSEGTYRVSILLGAGDGTFLDAQHVRLGGEANAISIGDFNRDAKLDLAAAFVVDDAVTILLGNGDGSFEAPLDFDAGIGGVGPKHLAAADFNADGFPDLAVTGSEWDTASTVSILLNDGKWASPSPLPGDFNLDGSVDAADYVVWRKTGGSQDDYSTWRANFGQTSGSGAAIPSADLLSAEVPEPASLVLCASCFWAISIFAFRKP